MRTKSSCPSGAWVSFFGGVVVSYKPIAPLASRAAEVAIALAKHSSVESNAKVNNGSKDVPSFLLTPIAVDKSNIVQTVIKDGFVKMEAVYRNVPREQWPKTNAK